MSGSFPPRSPRQPTPWAYAFYGIAIYLALLLASTIHADGLRNAHDAFATRLFLQPIATLVGVYRLDIATVVAVLITGFAFHFTEKSLRQYLLASECVHDDLRAGQYRAFCRTKCVVLLFLDGTFFFLGLWRPRGWEGAMDPVMAGLLAAMYLSLTVAMAYANIMFFLRPERN